MNSNSNVASSEPLTPPIKEVPGASPLRRFGAIVYDTLLVAALLMVVTALFLLITRAPVTPSSGWLLYLFRTVILVVTCLFFAYFWTAKGRTLGMQAWRIRIERIDGSLPSLRDVIMRLLFAALPWGPSAVLAILAVHPNAPRLFATMAYCLLALVPLNYASAWFDKRRRSWHDRFLQTRIVRQK
jgi:uncharacterized RDD family membrane protein YckC